MQHIRPRFARMMRIHLRPKRLAVLAMLVVTQFGLSACGTVAAWERDKLARPEMAWAPDSMDAQLDDHIYFSKEGSNGGGKAAGGGCGCN